MFPSLHGFGLYWHVKSVKMPHDFTVQLSRGSRQSAQGSCGAAAMVNNTKKLITTLYLGILDVCGCKNAAFGPSLSVRTTNRKKGRKLFKQIQTSIRLKLQQFSTLHSVSEGPHGMSTTAPSPPLASLHERPVMSTATLRHVSRLDTFYGLRNKNTCYAQWACGPPGGRPPRHTTSRCVLSVTSPPLCIGPKKRVRYLMQSARSPGIIHRIWTQSLRLKLADPTYLSVPTYM
jgi:hypothetical protein